MDRSNGERLRRLRGKRSLDEVAKACGIAITTLHSYENDVRTPRDEIKMRLSRYYGKSVKYLFFDIPAREMREEMEEAK